MSHRPGILPPIDPNAEQIMWNELTEWALARPERLKRWGRTLVSASLWVLLFAAFGRVCVIAGSSAARAAGDDPLTLAVLYPDLPTWWVPESVATVLSTLVVLAVGWWLNNVGRTYERVLRWR